MPHCFTCRPCSLLTTLAAVSVLVGRCVGENDGRGLAGMVERDITLLPTCYTILNDKTTVGCRTVGGKSLSVSAPVLPLESQKLLDDFAKSIPDYQGKKMVLLAHELMTAENLKALDESGLCSGVLVASPQSLVQAFSPADQEGYCKCEKTDCSGKWNEQPGNGIGIADVNFGVVLLDESSTVWIRNRLGKNGTLDETALTNIGPSLVVSMNYAMDVFRGYRKSTKRGGG